MTRWEVVVTEARIQPIKADRFKVGTDNHLQFFVDDSMVAEFATWQYFLLVGIEDANQSAPNPGDES